MAQKTLKYSRSDYNSKGVLGGMGYSRIEPYDTDYGTAKKPARTDYRLALLSETDPDGFIEKWQVLAELRKPIWGPNGNQKFEELLPETGMKALPNQNITVPEYLWAEYDPDNGQIPTEIGKNYELGLQMSPTSWRIILVPFDGNLTIFDVLKQYGLFTHFRLKNETGHPVIIPNPEYAIAVEIRAQEIAQVEALLKETFILTATHVFPGYPLNDVLAANLMEKYGFQSIDDIPPVMLWKWFDLNTKGEWEKIQVDPKHPLAISNPNGGWKNIRRPIRPNLNLTYYRSCVDRMFDWRSATYTPDEKLKRMLEII